MKLQAQHVLQTNSLPQHCMEIFKIKSQREGKTSNRRQLRDGRVGPFSIFSPLVLFASKIYIASQHRIVEQIFIPFDHGTRRIYENDVVPSLYVGVSELRADTLGDKFTLRNGERNVKKSIRYSGFILHVTRNSSKLQSRQNETAKQPLQIVITQETMPEHQGSNETVNFYK